MTEITLPLPPNFSNRRGHWATSHSAKVKYQRECYPIIREAFGLPPVVVFGKTLAGAVYDHVRISMDFYVWSLNDWDNLIARAKWAWDALAKCSVIPDDSPKHVDLGDVRQFVDRKHRRLVLRIETVE